jgi:hypothetical protein
MSLICGSGTFERHGGFRWEPLFLVRGGECADESDEQGQENHRGGTDNESQGHEGQSPGQKEKMGRRIIGDDGPGGKIFVHTFP